MVLLLIGKKQLKEAVDNIIFEEQYKALRESTYKGKHFYNSKNNSSDFDVKKFNKFKNQKGQKLSEKEMSDEIRENHYEEYKIKLKEDYVENNEEK